MRSQRRKHALQVRFIWSRGQQKGRVGAPREKVKKGTQNFSSQFFSTISRALTASRRVASAGTGRLDAAATSDAAQGWLRRTRARRVPSSCRRRATAPRSARSARATSCYVRCEPCTSSVFPSTAVRRCPAGRRPERPSRQRFSLWRANIIN